MIIDRKAKPWIIASAAVLALAALLFFRYAARREGGPSGGSAMGLTFGIAGSAAMIIAMLLALRKRVRALRVGRAYHWMQAHVWLGLLSYPLILFHAGGFSWGGTLTQVSMWIFTIVFISGIVGLVIQQSLPSKLLREVPAETIFEQTGLVLTRLRDEAEKLVRPVLEQQEQRELEAELMAAGPAAVATLRRSAHTGEQLQNFYNNQVVPFLGDHLSESSGLVSELAAQEAFHSLRQRLPVELHLTVAKLQTVVDERRQLHRQRRLHYWLHGWLLIHVPLSYALLVLGTVHAIMAFRYTSP